MGYNCNRAVCVQFSTPQPAVATCLQQTFRFVLLRGIPQLAKKTSETENSPVGAKQEGRLGPPLLSALLPRALRWGRCTLLARNGL